MLEWNQREKQALLTTLCMNAFSTSLPVQSEVFVVGEGGGVFCPTEVRMPAPASSMSPCTQNKTKITWQNEVKMRHEDIPSQFKVKSMNTRSPVH